MPVPNRDDPEVKARLLAPKRPSPPRARAVQKADPLESDRQVHTFTVLLAESVAYEQFIGLVPRLTMPDFLRLRNIYILISFHGLDAVAIAQKTGWEPAEIERLQNHAHIGAVGAAIEEQARRLAEKRGLAALAEDYESQIGAEMLAVALTSNGKEKLEALMQFADRRVAKKGREDDSPRAPMFPADALKLMAFALGAVATTALPGQEAEALPPPPVDGGVLNVPKRIGTKPAGGNGATE